MVQSLLDLLCSQLKNLLSQAAAHLLPSGADRDGRKQEEGADADKKDIRGGLGDSGGGVVYLVSGWRR